VDAGSAAEAELDALEGRAHVLDHEVEMARAARAAARHEQAAAAAALRQGEGDTTPGRPLELTSPLDGTVLSVNVEEAGPVAPGAPLVEVGAKAAMEVRVPMLSDVVPGLQPGMEAEVRDWGGPPLVAHAVRVEPKAVAKVPVLGGLSDGDEVVLFPDERVAEGVRVLPGNR